MRTSRPADGSRAPARRLIGALLAAMALAVLAAGPATAQAAIDAKAARNAQGDPTAHATRAAVRRKNSFNTTSVAPQT